MQSFEVSLEGARDVSVVSSIALEVELGSASSAVRAVSSLAQEVCAPCCDGESTAEQMAPHVAAASGVLPLAPLRGDLAALAEYLALQPSRARRGGWADEDALTVWAEFKNSDGINRSALAVSSTYAVYLRISDA